MATHRTKILLIALLCSTTASCGLFKKVSKHRSNVDSTSISESIKTLEITTKDVVDTTIHLPPDSSFFNFKLPESGDTLKMKDGDTEIRLVTKNGKEGAKGVHLSVFKDKDSLVIKKTTEKTIKWRDSSGVVTDLKKKTFDKQVEKKQGVRWYVYVISGLLLIVFIVIHFYTKGARRGINILKGD